MNSNTYEKQNHYNAQKEIKGELVKFENENFWKITNSDEMRPFFMSIVSDSNHWLFVSSNGGISAGRKNSEFAFFPYYTDDKITESAEITGSKTIFRISNSQGTWLWEPFSIRQEGQFKTTRNLYKNGYGNKVIFEEINHNLNLTFRYEWNTSNEFGFVKKSTLINDSSDSVEISLLDGFQNILPYGVPSDTQNRVSNLVDAYKKNELEKDAGLGIYALSAIIVDKAEPSEALKANIAWSLGLENPKYLVSSLQLREFRRHEEIVEETDIRAEKGAYFINSDISLESGAQKNWMLIGNVNQDHSAIAAIINTIKNDKNLKETVQRDIDKGTQALIKLTASADGIQMTNDSQRNLRHFANTLFNIMRGGIFDDNYLFQKWDFKNYLSKANSNVYASEKSMLDVLDEQFSLSKLREVASKSTNMDFRRLCMEYMPLKFSRRHGDPSRPWNRFSINTKSELDGSKILDYEGNWRDIFQNWEALALAFPEYIQSMIHKFLNASTFDGYNPYRVTKDGFDWETIEPDDPWSYIGYWGDHQIIYLLKFLEIAENHYPGQLANYFDTDIFVYANVPYKIKNYQELLENPKDTIDFDSDLDEHIRSRRNEMGADGALLRTQEGDIYRVNFIEKILATVLAKVSNFIPEAGIWLNTQRPEWNDANNALVGNGTSMVTLYYLRRFLRFLEVTIKDSENQHFSISEELLRFFIDTVDTLDLHEGLLAGAISDTDRKSVLDGLGSAGSQYRDTIYQHHFTGSKKQISKDQLLHFVKITLKYLEHSIEANKRSDHLYHAYNLMTVKSDTEISIDYLDVMLEGQVAVLSSGYLSASEALAVLDGMKNSDLFREDQYSYLLYPNKQLSRFMEKNVIPKSDVEKSELLQTLLKKNNTEIVIKDSNGNFHFNGNFNNAGSLRSALETLDASTYGKLIEREKRMLLDIFEKVFNHKSFTGRSGTFYGYEGLGSIYWHMVSKLLLAVQECCIDAVENCDDDKIVGGLLDHYYEINAGIGVHKSPELYGAFPTDPYSHTPGGKGVQQPGMTGQVKEDILSRIGELGVSVKNGSINFDPCLLRVQEFLNDSNNFHYVDVYQNNKTLEVPKNSLVFTYCQIPVIYHVDNENKIKVTTTGGHVEMEGVSLDIKTSKALFKRTGRVERIDVHMKSKNLK